MVTTLAPREQLSRNQIFKLTAFDFLVLIANKSSNSSLGLAASSSDEYSKPSISCSIIEPLSFARLATPLRTVTRDVLSFVSVLIVGKSV